MISVVRLKPPGFYISDKNIEIRKKIISNFDKQLEYKRGIIDHYPEFSNKQVQNQIQNYISKLRPFIMNMFYNKCAYCESKSPSIIDHFRPKQNAKGFESDANFGYYFWLCLVWENLYACCETCNNAKGEWFPVRNGIRAPHFEEYSKVVTLEQNILLDPCRDFVNSHFSYDKNGTILPLTEQGEVSIELLKLNREFLQIERARAYEETKALKKYFQSIFSKQENSVVDYIGIRNYALTNNDDRFYNLSKNPKPKKNNFQKETISNNFIKKIKIKDFKSIKSLDIDLSPKFNERTQTKAPWLVLLGENGTGKSSVLQAIAVASLDKKYLTSIKKDIINPIHYKANQSTIQIELDNDGGSRNICINKQLEITHHWSQEKSLNVICFGPSRIATVEYKAEITTLRHMIGNLFNHKHMLIDAKNWLIKVPQNIFIQAGEILISAFELDSVWRFTRNKDEVFIENKSRKIALSDVSDGYKSIMAIFINTIYYFGMNSENLNDITGIVFIDEIELHLHPRWKMRFVKSFRRAFPKIQVFATTHDPLCLKGLEEGEVMVLKTNKQRNTIALSNLPSPMGLKAEQLLTSEFFGLNSTIDPEDEMMFSEYYFLLGKSRLTPTQKNRLQNLKDQIVVNTQIGDSLRQDLIYDAVDRVLALNQKSGGRKSREVLKKETIDLINTILNKDDIY